MPLTRDFRETIQARVEREPSFGDELLSQGVECLLSGDVNTGKAILRDYVNATIGFQELGTLTAKSPKSLMRMFAPSGNPQARNLLQVTRHLQEREGLHLPSPSGSLPPLRSRQHLLLQALRRDGAPALSAPFRAALPGQPPGPSQACGAPAALARTSPAPGAGEPGRRTESDASPFDPHGAAACSGADAARASRNTALRGTSASTARASSDRAPLRSTSVNGSENVDGWESFKTVLSLTAYHSFVGEVEAQSPPRYAALTLHPVTNFWP